MIKEGDANIFTVGIGGAAGDGVREAGSNLGLLLADLGYAVYMSFTYPSLIRGGHNFARISFSKEKIWCDYSQLDVLIALNAETVELHKNELNLDSHVFSEESLPMTASAKEIGAPAIARNSMALGAPCYLPDLPQA